MKLKYTCPHCMIKSYSKLWNAETMKKYGTYSNEIFEIQQRENNSFHICPNPECRKESQMFEGDLIKIGEEYQ